MNATADLTPNTTARIAREERTAIAHTSATIRLALCTLATEGDSTPGVRIGLALAHCECPGSIRAITDADIDAILSTLGA